MSWILVVYKGCVRGMQQVDSLWPMTGLEPVDGYVQSLVAAAAREVCAWLAGVDEAARPESGPAAAQGEEEAARIGTAMYLRCKMVEFCRQVLA